MLFSNRSVGISAPSPRALHSAGIIGNNLIVFGGKSYIRSHSGSTCFTNDIMVYSIGIFMSLLSSFTPNNAPLRTRHNYLCLHFVKVSVLKS